MLKPKADVAYPAIPAVGPADVHHHTRAEALHALCQQLLDRRDYTELARVAGTAWKYQQIERLLMQVDHVLTRTR